MPTPVKLLPNGTHVYVRLPDLSASGSEIHKAYIGNHTAQLFVQEETGTLHVIPYYLLMKLDTPAGTWKRVTTLNDVNFPKFGDVVFFRKTIGGPILRGRLILLEQNYIVISGNDSLIVPFSEVQPIVPVPDADPSTYGIVATITAAGPVPIAPVPAPAPAAAPVYNPQMMQPAAAPAYNPPMMPPESSIYHPPVIMPSIPFTGFRVKHGGVKKTRKGSKGSKTRNNRR